MPAIPESTKTSLAQRLRAHARVNWPQLSRVHLRYRGPFAYIDPAVVEELWWLRCAHHDAYHGPHASAAKAGDWHDRQRTGVTKRLRTWLRDCDLTRHQHDLPTRAVPLAGSADRIAAAWTQLRTTPLPTPEELTEADAHDRHEHRTSHR